MLFCSGRNFLICSFASELTVYWPLQSEVGSLPPSLQSSPTWTSPRCLALPSQKLISLAAVAPHSSGFPALSHWSSFSIPPLQVVTSCKGHFWGFCPQPLSSCCPGVLQILWSLIPAESFQLSTSLLRSNAIFPSSLYLFVPGISTELNQSQTKHTIVFLLPAHTCSTS